MSRKIKLLLGVIAIALLAACTTPPDPIPDTLENASAEAEIEPEPTNTLSPPTEVSVAGDVCGVAGQQQKIQEAFADFHAQDDALLDLNSWVNGLTAQISAECNGDLFELSDPAELADLLAKLYDGGYVIYVRHTHTDRSRGDTDVSLGSCETQRILSERGRDEALMIRNAYDQLDLPIGQIISTQYCRTLETAILAFDVPFVVSRTDLTESLPEVLATAPEPGTNTIIVAHIGTLRQTRDLDDTFDEGDSLVYRPTGNGEYEFVGRIGLYDWPVMASLK